MQSKSYSPQILLIALKNTCMILLLTFYMTVDYIVMNGSKMHIDSQSR